jgi:hypothetical protein
MAIAHVAESTFLEELRGDDDLVLNRSEVKNSAASIRSEEVQRGIESVEDNSLSLAACEIVDDCESALGRCDPLDSAAGIGEDDLDFEEPKSVVPLDSDFELKKPKLSS